MQNVFKLAAVAALCATAVAAHAEAKVDANLELDTTYTNAVKAPATNARASDLGMGGRVEVNVSGKATNGDAFVAGKGTVTLQKNGDTGVDDMWVQAGNSGMDVKLGKFEGVNLFPLGKDTLLEQAGYSAYQGNKLRGRFGSDTVHGALGINAGAGVRVEVGLVYSKDEGASRGVRPAVTFTSGPITVNAGFESVKVVGTNGSNTGVSASLGYALSSSASLNFNVAKMEDDKSLGLNATFGDAGVGLLYGKGATSADKVSTVYAAYTLPLFGVKGASITPAVSFSKGGTGTDNQVAARVRINYSF